MPSEMISAFLSAVALFSDNASATIYDMVQPTRYAYRE